MVIKMNKYIFILIFVSILSSASQVLLKKSALISHKNFISQYINLYVIMAYFIFFIVLFINIFLIKNINLAIVSIITETLPLVLSTINGKIFFDECISFRKVIGIIIILIGIIIIFIL